jgi:hypothetical protein
LFLQKQQTLVSLNIVFGRYCFKTQTVPGLENVMRNYYGTQSLPNHPNIFHRTLHSL